MFQRMRHVKTITVSLADLYEEEKLTGEYDFQQANKIFKESTHVNYPQGIQHLEAAIKKNHTSAKFVLARFLIAGKVTTKDEMRGYQLLTEIPANYLANTNYMLALLIIKAHEFNYDPAKVVVDTKKMLTGDTDKELVYNLLRNEQVLNQVKQKYAYPKGKKFALQLLADCGFRHVDARLLLKQLKADNTKAPPHTSFAEKKAEIKSVIESNETVKVAKKASKKLPPAIEQDPLQVLETLYKTVYGNSNPFEYPENANHSEKIWQLINMGLTHGKGELYFRKLKELNIFAILFPSVMHLSSKQQIDNDTWLANRLKLIDNRPDKDRILFPRFSAALMAVYALPPNVTPDDFERVYKAYNIPFASDPSFIRSVQYNKKRKEDFFVTLNILKLIFDSIYSPTAMSEKELSVRINEEKKNLERASRSFEFWDLIYKGFAGGHGTQFLEKLKKHDVYTLFFPHVLPISKEEQQKNEAWFKDCIENIDRNPSRKNITLFKIAILFVAKELSDETMIKSKALEVHSNFQIPVTWNDDFHLTLCFEKIAKRHFVPKQDNELLVKNTSYNR